MESCQPGTFRNATEISFHYFTEWESAELFSVHFRFKKIRLTSF